MKDSRRLDIPAAGAPKGGGRRQEEGGEGRVMGLEEGRKDRREGNVVELGTWG